MPLSLKRVCGCVFRPRSEATRELYKSTRKVGLRAQSASQDHRGIHCSSNLTERKSSRSYKNADVNEAVYIKSRNVVYGDHRDLHVNNLCRVEGEIRLWSPTINCKFILTSSLNVLCHMLFVSLFIYRKRAVMLFKRRLYNLIRVF